MKKVISLVLSFVLVLGVVAAFAACGGEAKTDLEYIKDKGKMVIGYTLFAPMNYTDAEGNLTGFETEFATAVCKELGVEAEFQLISWEAKETELKSKTIDCIWNGMTITAERQAEMSISTPYMANKQVLVVKAENADKYLTAEALKEAKVVAESGSAGEEVAKTDALFANAQYTGVKDQAAALLEVKTGTADAAVVDYVLSIGMIGEGTDYADLVVVSDKEFSPEQYGIAFRKEDAELTKAVNDAMTKLVQDGTLGKIAEKYKLEDQILVK